MDFVSSDSADWVLNMNNKHLLVSGFKFSWRTQMKKSMIALAVLGATATVGVAQAATSVTLYGRLDVGYVKSNSTSWSQGVGTNAAGFSTEGETRFGVRGSEDLGNGLSATFQLEGRFDGSNGSKTVTGTGTELAFFDRESTVGLRGAFGHVRLGRSLATMERGLGFVNVGRRIWDNSPYASAARHSNGLFYTYAKSAFEVGADVTTKGGYAGNTNEGLSAQKVAYGAYAKYSANGLTVGAAYQADKVKANASIAKEYGLGLGYAFSPVKVGLSYAIGKGDNGNNLKSRVAHAYIGADITPNDFIAALYHGDKRTTEVASVKNTTVNTRAYGLEYVHSLSKRTSVYADVARVQNRVTDVNSTAWDVAVRHNF